ncbi:hypothetical protein [Streptomyces sp. CBMA123]|uniref:hypothetical protein n=1 Tax=Streptomyces sp. CBMA123 TaxID=1896313 RepID=UPI001661D53C|nr:hypothetical protein [Streptomyces sp. CBMA123]MBD0696113.1 hypothetical protein [Streptomyces sp. CBMA123]
MTTAHELHAKGLREHLAPALRGLGLTGRHPAFLLPDEDHWMLLGLVERPAADRVAFTFGLSLVRRADWAAPAPPDPHTRYGFEVWRARIGEVLPVGEDVWWEVLPGPRWQLTPSRPSGTTACRSCGAGPGRTARPPAGRTSGTSPPPSWRTSTPRC